MSAYYNEIDPRACAWLSELMAEGLIPQGEIDQRSIVDVRASDLRGFRQCHFFAGISGWSHALKLAGWPEDREVWTGSCPCQPLSCAGKGKGDADKRHLWPAFYRLISECRPAIVFGEQVASKAGREWFSGVRADLEGMGYACGGADLCSAGVGSPNIRQRLYWVGYSTRERQESRHSGRYSQSGEQLEGAEQGSNGSDRSTTGRLDNSPSARSESAQSEPESDPRNEARLRGSECRCSDGRVADSTGTRLEGTAGQSVSRGSERPADGSTNERHPGLARRPSIPANDGEKCATAERAGDSCGFWSSAIWHQCRDGKQRRISPEPSIQLVASGISTVLGDCWNQSLQKVQERIINYAESSDKSSSEILPALWCHILSEEISSRGLGANNQFPEAEVLLTALFQLAGQMGQGQKDLLQQGFLQDEAGCLPSMRQPSRESTDASRSPQGRELGKQHTQQLADLVHELSHEVAQFKDASGIVSCMNMFPLATKLPGRVGLLRGAGNAINVQLAKEFIQAVMECV